MKHAAAPSVAVPFAKAEANGNDFLIVPAEALPRAQWPAFARLACDRHRGIGADGVEFVAPLDAPAAMRLTLLNADGGEAEISGNGSRCVAAWQAARSGLRELTLQTAAGSRNARVVSVTVGGEWMIDLDMGPPEIATPEPGAESEFEVEGRRWRAVRVSMGNPHCCIFVDAFPPDWEIIGAHLERDPHFPHRTNVEFIRVLARELIELRLFERGVGPTQSSGTGSCAAAVAAIATGRAGSPLEVLTPGGAQTVAWAGAGAPAPVYLHGPARVIGAGHIDFAPR